MWGNGMRAVEAPLMSGGIRAGQKQEQELNSHYFLNRYDQEIDFFKETFAALFSSFRQFLP